MILLDLNGLFISQYFFLKKDRINPTYEDLRKVCLLSFKHYREKFFNEYGELVIAVDSKSNWRKSYFPYYKIKRKIQKNNDVVNWDKINLWLKKFCNEIYKNLPYKIISVKGLEADDIIYCLVNKYHKQEKIVIVSADKDFIQLLRYDNTFLYNPKLKEYVVHDNPELYLEEHILKGDSGDSIPNIFSEDDIFTIPGKRQSPMTKKRLAEFLDNPEKLKDYEHNYNRNKTLIDMRCVPSDLYLAVLRMFEKEPLKSRKDILNYFIKENVGISMNEVKGF